MFETPTIRVATDKDLQMLLYWRNHISIRQFMLTQHEISLEEHSIWFARISTDQSRRLLIVEDRKTPIGCVQFSNIASNGVVDWGFYVRPDAPKGSGKKLGQAALNHAFGSLKLHKICGQALDGNIASIEFHKRLGFSQEGALREQQCINGVFHTLICFGLLKHEWKSGATLQEGENAED